MLSLMERLRSSRLSIVIDFMGNLYLALWNWFFSYCPSYAVRRVLLNRMYGVQMGRNVSIHMGVKFLKPWGVAIGNNVNIQMGSFIDGRGGVAIGDNVDITLYVKILSQQHDIQDGIYTTQSKAVAIGNNCVLGSFSLIMPGVQLGEGVVIGAGSVVPKSIPQWSIAVGNPCVVKKKRNQDIKYQIGYKRYFH
jgi:putative colanic acid biosynthesis acetyltransferase WcaF